MNALFMADAHLRDAEDPALGKILRCLSCLQGPGKKERPPVADPKLLVIDLLVIAGDFFDFWFAKDEKVYPGFRPMIDRLAALKKEGVRIVICEGNHDFHLTDYFAGHLGFEVYVETADLVLDGKRILVAHGDTVDLGNLKYLTLRRFLRSTFACRLQGILPLPLLWGVARFSSELSKGMSLASKDRLVEIMHCYARKRFSEGYDAVILGHCHQPFLSEESGKTFATLGDWLLHDSYLLYREGIFALQRL